MQLCYYNPRAKFIEYKNPIKSGYGLKACIIPCTFYARLDLTNSLSARCFVEVIVVIVLLLAIGIVIAAFYLLLSTYFRTGTLIENQEKHSREIKELKAKLDRATPKEEIKAATIESHPPATVKAEVNTPKLQSALSKTSVSRSTATHAGFQAKTFVSKPEAAVPHPVKPLKEFLDFPEQVQREPSEFERRSTEILRKMWNWLIVGEEFRNPEMTREYQAATAWLLRSAILLIVFGVAYFIKYSHDNNLFPPALRLGISTLFALGMFAGGCFLLKGRYKIFGVTMIGGGFAGLYLVVFASVSIYHLIATLTGLGLLALLTAAGCVMALRLNQMLLAILAIVGGYLAPVLLSTETHNLPGLYSYMLVLTVGALVIAYYRNWQILNILSFLLAWTIFFVAKPFRYDQDIISSLAFAGAFFLAFSMISVRFNVVNRIPITFIEIFFQMLNTLIFLGGTIPMVWDEYGKEKAGALTLLVSIYYILQLAYLLWKKSQDKNLILVQSTLATSLLAFALPLMLVRDVITIAWAIQATAMLYIGCRTRSNFIAQLSFAIFTLAAGRLLFINLPESYGPGAGKEFLSRLINFGGLTLAMIAGYLILRRYGHDSENDSKSWLSPDDSPLMKIFFWSMMFIIAIAGFGEFIRLGRSFSTDWSQTGIFCWGAILLLILAILHGRYREQWIARMAMFGVAALAIYMLGTIFCISNFNYSPGWALLRLGRFVLALGIVILGGSVFSRHGSDRKSMYTFLSIAEIVWFLYTTLELSNLMQRYSPGGEKIAISLLWGAHALMLIGFGVMQKWKTTRMFGLLLLVIAMFKIFMVDLSHAPALYRIAGCMLLGIIMMAGAWFYTRFQSKFNTRE